VTTDQQRLIAALERENRELRRQRDTEGGNGFLCAGARPATAEVVTFITVHRESWGIEPVCKALQVAPSTYYAAVSAKPPQNSGRFTCRERVTVV
jgi:hypothetical protein